MAMGIIQCPVTRLAAHFDKDRTIIVPWLHPDHDERVYQPHVKALRALGCHIVLPSNGELQWKAESGWMNGMSAVVDRLGIIDQEIHQMLWAAHHE